MQTLEIQGSRALLEKKDDKLREELSKDVPSFANSAGEKSLRRRG
jgi:hypothetical protein